MTLRGHCRPGGVRRLLFAEGGPETPFCAGWFALKDVTGPGREGPMVTVRRVPYLRGRGAGREDGVLLEGHMAGLAMWWGSLYDSPFICV